MYEFDKKYCFFYHFFMSNNLIIRSSNSTERYLCGVYPIFKGIVMNGAHCKMCKETISQKNIYLVIICKCNNVAIGVIENIIVHFATHSKYYSPRVIVKID